MTKHQIRKPEDEGVRREVAVQRWPGWFQRGHASGCSSQASSRPLEGWVEQDSLKKARWDKQRRNWRGCRALLAFLFGDEKRTHWSFVIPIGWITFSHRTSLTKSRPAWYGTLEWEPPIRVVPRHAKLARSLRPHHCQSLHGAALGRAC